MKPQNVYGRAAGLAGRQALFLAAVLASLIVAGSGFSLTWQAWTAVGHATERLIDVSDASSELRGINRQIMNDFGMVMAGTSPPVERMVETSRAFVEALARLGEAIQEVPDEAALYEDLRAAHVELKRVEPELFGLLRAGDIAGAWELSQRPEYLEQGVRLTEGLETLLLMANENTHTAYVENQIAQRNALIASAAGFLVIIVLWTAIALDWFKQARAAHLLNHHLERVVEDRTRKIEEALREANAANRAKSDFLATMSHEVRTPLNGVLGMAQVLAGDELTDVQRERVGTIIESGQILLSILNDVLDLSKVEAGKLEINTIAFDLRHTIQRTYELFRPSAEEKDIALEVVFDPTAPGLIMGDPVRVRQCVSNLISNAIKFTSRGHVRVRLAARPLRGKGPDALLVSVAVEDTGIGLDEDTVSRLFQPFSQVDSSTTRLFGGTGLGLTISRRLANMMGGDVTVTSAPGVGSTFTFTFAALAAEFAAASIDHASPAPQVASLRGARILLVDDNPMNREVARLFLRPLRAILIEAENGRQALDVLAVQEVDLVLLDIHMPFMDGPQTLARLRASNWPSRNAPVIALTADAMPEDRERFKRLGMAGYIAKPMDQREVLAEIGRVLGVDPITARDDAPPPGVASERRRGVPAVHGRSGAIVGEART